MVIGADKIETIVTQCLSGIGYLQFIVNIVGMLLAIFNNAWQLFRPFRHGILVSVTFFTLLYCAIGFNTCSIGFSGVPGPVIKVCRHWYDDFFRYNY